MKWKRLVVALLLLAPLGNPASAAETPEHRSKNARKLLAALDSLGINNPDITYLVKEVDSRVKDGYVSLAEHKMPGATVRLQYTLGGGVKLEQLQLKFKPDDSNWEATASKEGVWVRYQLKF